jgi:hypothetical protein
MDGILVGCAECRCAVVCAMRAYSFSSARMLSMHVSPATSPYVTSVSFRKVLSGMDTVYKFDKLPTKKEGIFVMPLDRITILSTFVVYVDDPHDTEGTTFVLNKHEISSSSGSKQDSTSMLLLSASCIVFPSQLLI